MIAHVGRVPVEETLLPLVSGVGVARGRKCSERALDDEAVLVGGWSDWMGNIFGAWA